MANPIVHYEIPAGDVQKLMKFYEQCFGWKFDKAKIPGIEYWLFTTGPKEKTGGAIFPKSMEPRDPRPRIFVQVGNIDTAMERLNKAGGTIITGKQEVPGMGFATMGQDPEGNLVGLWQPLQRSRRQARKSKSRK